MIASERRAWVVAARTDLDLADLLLHASCSERINTQAPEFAQGLGLLAAKGILTQDRVEEILNS